MFSNDHNISMLRNLVLDAKDYAGLRARLLKLDVVQKMTVLLTALIVGAVLFVLAAIIVLFLSLMAAQALASLLGSTSAAYGIVAVAYLLIALFVYAKRQTWIAEPLAGLLGKLFLEESDEEEGGEDAES